MRWKVLGLTAICTLPLMTDVQSGGLNAAAVTFHKDVAPILQRRCQGCHRPGDVAPMPLLTYEQARPYARAIRSAVLQKTMPPWFAEAGIGHFANDRTLSQSEIDTLVRWAETGAAEGNRSDAPAPMKFTEGWRMGEPDVVLELPKPFDVPATGTVPYQYVTVATGFTEDKWVEAVEVQAGNRSVVHHINVSTQMPSAAYPTGQFVSRPEAEAARARRRELPQFSFGTDWEMLEVHVPGGVTPVLKPGQARLVKAGSEILFQLHYTPNGKPAQDRSRVGLIFAKQPPKERIKGVLVFNQRFTIPAGAPNHRIEARATVEHDVKLTAMLPHMHLRGKSMEYRAIYPSGEKEVLLRVPRYDFNWQLTYYLEKPKPLPKGTLLEVVGHYDNSRANRHNPDPTIDVEQGNQTWEEMLNGFMDVAMEPRLDTPAILGPAPAVVPTADKVSEPAAITFSKDVAPILQKRCQGCHRPGEAGPMSLQTYQEARPWARSIREKVVRRQMPPWPADPGHGRFRNNPSLTDREINVLTWWADNGAREGDPRDLPKPLVFQDGWNIGRPDAVLQMPVAFQVPAQGTVALSTRF